MSEREKRTFDLMGARIVGIEVDGGLAYLDVEHKGCDDEAARLLVRIPDIEWRYPAPGVIAEWYEEPGT